MNRATRALLLTLLLFSGVSMAQQPSAGAGALNPADPGRMPLDDPLLSSQGSWNQAYADQWNLAHIGLVSPQGLLNTAIPRQLQPVTVALIDSGVDYRHPDLPLKQLWRNPNERDNGRDDDGNGLIDDLIGWNFVGRNNTPWDDHGHGTHIAGIIAAGQNNGIGISGIAPNARLMVLKVVDASGHASGSHIAGAIRYAVDQGARLIHLSLGGQQPGDLELDALNYALDQDVLVITAAGNQASDDPGRGYDQLPSLLVVGAVAPDGRRAAFSDWGTTLDLMAPGVNVLSLRAKGSDFLRRNGVQGYRQASAVVSQEYYRATGTSFAAPHVTAIAALLLGRDPQLTSAQLRRILLHSARDLGPTGTDRNHGYGLLDAEAALSATPEYFVEARLERAELDSGNQLLLIGTTDADQFLQARIDYALGEPPQQWKTLLPIAQPLREQPLLSLDPSTLPEGELMTLRLVTEHQDGSRRESRLQLQLPGEAP
ncbi:S8 family peptidase [Motiliproteus sp.]|uniref:S8 family peptidase n=1 Tax=Motiliproteus sp. TaxID=1898955 RepID=UPI003BAC744E